MAFMTAAEILERFETVLQADPCLLRPSAHPFTNEQTPNINVGTTFRLEHGGMVNDKCQSNYAEARIDRIIVTVQYPLEMDGYTAQRTLQDLLDTIERAIIDDGPDHSYNADIEKGSRKVTRPKDTDVAEGKIHFLVDYDFNSSIDAE
jgi:hypothetical protein